ncbi:MAG: hypothetical protein J5685_12785 [Clostridiales bacterium]|nr:hypothetical protein [Clostridiales bacterium]
MILIIEDDPAINSLLCGILEKNGYEARSGEGAGLGLYIVRKFTEALGGKISASQTGDRLTTVLVLPEAIKSVLP